MARFADRVRPALSVAAHLGRGVQRVATDAVVGRQRSIPRTIEGLDAAYLSQLMGHTVTSVSVIGGDAGTSTRARLALTGDGVPDSVFVKMAAETVATRLMGEVGILGETETRFYKELVARADRRTEVVWIRLRPAYRPIRHRAGGSRGRCMRVPGHLASAHRRPGQPDRRTPCPTTRHVLGTPAPMAAPGIGRQVHRVDPACF